MFSKEFRRLDGGCTLFMLAVLVEWKLLLRISLLIMIGGIGGSYSFTHCDVVSDFLFEKVKKGSKGPKS